MALRKTAAIGSLLFVTALWGGCANSVDDREVGAACKAGEATSCLCAAGGQGIKACSSDGSSFGACECIDAGPGVCGDQSCGSTETCRSCPKDCGACPKCDTAPSCTGAEGVPSSTTPRPDLNLTDKDYPELSKPDGGVALSSTQGCDAAQLRLRIEKIKTYKGGAEIYCIVNATDGKTSEVAITPKTKGLADGESYFFAPDVGLVWGQKDIKSTSTNLTITYNCVRVKGDSFAKVLQAASDASAKVAGVAGPYGWAFGLGSVGAGVASAAVQASSGDEQILNAQQVIDAKGLLDLTNNRSWVVRKSQDGGLFGYSWDWELTVQSWGCADGVGTPK